MTPQSLKALILADAAAAVLFAAGKDGECAEYLRANYQEPRSYQVTKLQLHLSFGLARGVQIMQSLRSISQSQAAEAPLFAELVDLLESQNASRGPDLGLAETEVLLSGWQQAGIITAGEKAVLLALGKQPLSVSAQQVEFARTRI
jgi:hypothetical protein